MIEQYTEAEFLRDYNNGLQRYTQPGYPAYEDRLRLDHPDQLIGPDGNLYIPYDPDEPWSLANYRQEHPPEGDKTTRFVDEGGIYPPTSEELAAWEAMGGVQLDQRGMPVHPYAKAMLLGGYTPEGQWVHPGAAVTPGAYFKRGFGRGLQKTADFLLLAEHQGALHGLFIERRRGNLLAIPGGHLEEEDTQNSQAPGAQLSEHEFAAIRELPEETGIQIEVTPEGLSCDGLQVVLQETWDGLGADQRATVHAGPKGKAFTAFLPRLPKQKPQASSDAAKAMWLPLGDRTFERLKSFSNHHTIGRRAVRLYCDQTGARIDHEGNIL